MEGFMFVNSYVRVKGGFFAREALRKAIHDGIREGSGGSWEVRAVETSNAILVTISGDNDFLWKNRFTGDPAKPDLILAAIRKSVAQVIADELNTLARA